MPFISNDTNFLLIDDEEYNKNRNKYRGYVVVRRLFVRIITPFLARVSKR